MLLDSETNVCYVSKLLAKHNRGVELIEEILLAGISVELLEDTRDIWARDYMPIQISDDKFIGFEFAPDYLYYDDYIRTISSQARVCDRHDIDIIPSGLIIDGGKVVKTSNGIIMVDKVFRENYHFTKIELINRLERCFESEIIFLPWDKAEIFGHADGIVREISPGKVIMTNYHQHSKRFADSYHKILSQHFDLEVLDYVVKRPHPHNWCYINFLRVGNKILVPQLTDRRRVRQVQASHSDFSTLPIKGKEVEEDNQAIEQIERHCPDCEIIPVSCPQIVAKGGALNCISWTIKRSIGPELIL